MTNTEQSNPEQNRLDRELAEILDQAERRPISIQDRVAQQRATIRSKPYLRSGRHQASIRNGLDTVVRLVMRIPLMTALLLALAAVWLSADYQLAATLVALTAAAFVFIPYVRRPVTTPASYQKRWRGRKISSFPQPDGPSNDVAGSIRSWVSSHRNRSER